jgi:hypothetical protein
VDEKKEFFEQYLLGHYLCLVSESARESAAKVWETVELAEYLGWCREQLESEEKFASATLARGKKRESVEAVIACMFDAIVGAYKEKIYGSNQQALFE